MTARSRATRASRSTAEKVSFAIACVIVLAIAATIAVLGSRDARPPELTAVLVGEPRTSGSQTYVTAEVRNSGTAAVEEVQVVAELVAGGEATPVGDQVVGFLAGGGSSRVVIVLNSPEFRSLTVRVQSYTESR